MTVACDVVLVGGNSIVREGLRRLLSEQERKVLYACASLDDLDRVDIASEAHLLLLIEEPGTEWDGKSLAQAHQRFPAARIAILANQFDFDAMLESFRSGAEGYLTNDLSWERLIGYLDLIALGEKIFPSQLAQKLIDQCSAPNGQPTNAVAIQSANLSAREMEILRRLIAGLPNKVISRELSISEATVKVHVKAVLRKLGVANRTQAAIWAAAQGLQSQAPEGSIGTPAGGMKASTMARAAKIGVASAKKPATGYSASA